MGVFQWNFILSKKLEIFSIVYFDNKKHFYINLMILECFIKLYYKMKENYTLNSNNL